MHSSIELLVLRQSITPVLAALKAALDPAKPRTSRDHEEAGMNHPTAAIPTLTDKLIARKEGAIGWVIFNNPDRHNASSLEMWQSLPLVLDAYVKDPEVRVIVFRGT